MDNLRVKETISFLKNRLKVHCPNEDFSNMKPETDLSSFDIDSIILMTLLSEVEGEFSFKISLDKLEKNNFKITPLILTP